MYVNGVYKPGNVKLSPKILLTHQEYTKKKINSPLSRPIFLVMHGGSGSTDDEKPNKKFYDPRVWLRKSEESMVLRY